VSSALPKAIFRTPAVQGRALPVGRDHNGSDSNLAGQELLDVFRASAVVQTFPVWVFVE
jgi:hypothetical protein